MKFIFSFISLSFVLVTGNVPAGFSQNLFSVFLVGDAGKDTTTNELLGLLKTELEKNTGSAVVFLGDNIYPKGFLEKKNQRHELEKKRIVAQMSILNNYKGSAFFVPGNHDWRIGKLNGKKAVIQEGNFVDRWCVENTKLKNKDSGIFFPGEGNPGPVSISLSPVLKLVLIDTQWWLQPFEANRYEKNFFLMQLDSVLGDASSKGEKIIIAAHHPLFSNGRHSKNRQPFRFLNNYSPLQIFGILGLNRLFAQDLQQPKYRKLKTSLLNIFEKYPGIIYAAGHEHNLQFKSPSPLKNNNQSPENNFTMGSKPVNNGDDFFIVSGSGSKVTPLSEKKYSPEFSFDKGPGFFRIDFTGNGKFIVSAFTPVNGKLEKIYNAIF